MIILYVYRKIQTFHKNSYYKKYNTCELRNFCGYLTKKEMCVKGWYLRTIFLPTVLTQKSILFSWKSIFIFLTYMETVTTDDSFVP